MEHLEFVDKLNQLGCSFRSTNVENKTKEVEVPNYFGGSDVVEIKNMKCNGRVCTTASKKIEYTCCYERFLH